MDVLAEVLRAIKLDAAVYFNGEFSAPWCVESPEVGQIAGYLTHKGGHVVIFHTIVEGKATIRVPGGRTEEVSAGSIIVLPHGSSHLLGSGAAGRPSDATAMLKNHVEGKISVMRAGGGGETTKLVCGFLACDPRLSQTLLSGLPPLLIVPIKPGTAGDWIQHSLQFLASAGASSVDGRDVVLAKLSEVLLLETLRQYADDLPRDHESWFAGIRDPYVGRALALLHQHPERSWTLITLGRDVGLSRTRLAERFARFIGQPPMTYLTEWRLRLAGQLLTSGNASVAEIASQVGYGSEASFCRAFKKEWGMPPATYRRSQRTAPASLPAKRSNTVRSYPNRSETNSPMGS